MLRKIILPLFLLIFTHQEFYGMDNPLSWLFDNLEPISAQEIQENRETWNNYVYYLNKSCYINHNYRRNFSTAPLLWPLWAFFDNVLFQYGGSKKIWKHGMVYYGLSNGIGFFPSVLNFGWLKIGFVDAHINVINLILDYLKNFIQCKTDKKNDILPYLSRPICINLLFNIHIFSVKILNCIKIKLISPLTLLLALDGDQHFVDKGGTAWYITYNESGQIPWSYALLSPRIEINIPGIIKYFRRE